MFRQKAWSAIVLLTLAILINVAGSLLSQDPQPQPGQPSPEDMQAMQEAMEKWMATMSPGEEHAALEPFVGEFKAVNKMWMEPGGEPIVTEGSLRSEWILGGRYVLGHYNGVAMMPDMETGELKGTPFEGIAISGYDRNRHIYTNVWLDSLSTAPWIAKGSTPDGKLFNYYGEMDEPMLGVIGRTVKEKIRVIDNDTHVMEMFDLHAGDDYKIMEITYTRLKSEDGDNGSDD